MSLEYCGECASETGNAGRGEDSIFIEYQEKEIGPLCSECSEKYIVCDNCGMGVTSDTIEQLAKELDSCRAREEWQPIETAPKGKWVLVTDQHNLASWQACYNKEKARFATEGGMILFGAKWWKEMPAPKALSEPPVTEGSD